MDVAEPPNGPAITSLATLPAPGRHTPLIHTYPQYLTPTTRPPSNIRTQKIILHTRLHLPRRRLQELSPFQPNPDLNHGEIAFAGALEERCTAALGAELAEDGESTRKEGVS